MSYDVDLVIDTGNPDGLTCVCVVGGITYNVGPMFEKALRVALKRVDGSFLTGRDYSINRLHNATAGSCVTILRKAIEHMEDNRIEYEKLNPENGWGDYDGALAFMRKLKDCCINHPKTLISVY